MATLPEDDKSKTGNEAGSKEHEEKVMLKTVELIAKYGVEGPAIFALEVIKPLAYVGGQFARFFLAPFLPAFGESGDDLIATLERQDNIEKIIKMIEEKEKEKRRAQAVAARSKTKDQSGENSENK